MGKPVVKQGPVEEYLVLAYCQDKQFANHGKREEFTCRGIARGMKLKLPIVESVVRTLVEGNSFRYIDSEERVFVLKGHQQSWNYNVKGQLHVEGWEDVEPRDVEVRRYLGK